MVGVVVAEWVADRAPRRSAVAGLPGLTEGRVTAKHSRKERSMKIKTSVQAGSTRIYVGNLS